MHCLIVDDDLASSRLLAARMAHMGFDAVISDDGRLAAETCLRAETALVFLDFDMPLLDGFGTAREIRLAVQAEGRWQPFIVGASGFVNPERVRRALRSGMNRVEDKLTLPQRLGDIVECAVDYQSLLADRVLGGGISPTVQLVQ